MYAVQESPQEIQHLVVRVVLMERREEGREGRENIITPFLNKNTLFTRKLLGIQLSSIPLILLNSQAFG